MIDRLRRLRPALERAALVSVVVAAGAVVVAAGAGAQGAPSTDIHLVPLRARGDSVTVGAAVNITPRTGYDNQPSFTPDGR